MSEAKVEQQSTETLSFRCWCERCRLTRGRIVKQSRATELGWGEGSTVIQAQPSNCKNWLINVNGGNRLRFFHPTSLDLLNQQQG